MAFNLCCSSPLKPLFTSHTRRPNGLNNSSFVSLQRKITTQVSSQVHENASNTSSFKSVWVNPESPRASRLRNLSNEERYEKLRKVSEALNNCNSNENDVFEILKTLGDKVNERDAVVIINDMVNCDNALLALRYFQGKVKIRKEVIAYNVTMKVFRKCKDFGGVEKLFDEMLERGAKPDNVTFSTVISCARLCNLPDKAVEWFEKMESFGCEPDHVTYSAMIDAYGRMGNIGMALSLYDRARSEKRKIDPVAFATLIKIYGMEGNYDGCLNVYEEMKVLGVKPNLVIYNTLLDGMGRAKRPWHAKMIYKDLTNNGFTPNWVTYAALLRAFSRARYGEDALKIYKEMKEKGYELNVILYNTILSMCADLGLVDEAADIYSDLKSSGKMPDCWTVSSMITVYSCSGKVSEAEAIIAGMPEAGLKPTLFILTSLIQCYAKAGRTDDVVKTFDQVLELNMTPDDRFCGCLLNALTLTPREDLGKVIDCIEKSNRKLGHFVKLLVQEQESDLNFKEEALEFLDSIDTEVKKSFCNCLIDLCVNLNLLEKACELFETGLAQDIYKDIQSRSPTQWSLHLKSLSLGAALTALHVWMNDLTKTLDSREEFPPLLGINTGHGKHRYSDKGLAGVFESRLKELNAPFHEAPDDIGWFITTKDAGKSWLESRKSTESLAA